MGLDKNFVVRNGLEIASDLIFADSVSNKAGIGTTTPGAKLDVSGDASVSGDFRATGIATVGGSFDIGIAGTALRVRNGVDPRYNTSRVGINTGDPEYNLEVIGDVGISSNTRVGGASTFVGLSSFYDHVHIPDTKELRFGKSDGDLIVYHDGSNSFIDEQGTGGLYIRAGNKIGFRDSDNSYANFANFNSGGSVELYYNGLKKLETITDGISVQGAVVSDQLLVTGIATIAQCDINSGDIDIETAFVGYSTVTNSNIVRGVVGIETVTGIFNVTGTSEFDNDILFDSSNKIRYDISESAFRFDDNAVAQFGTGSDYEIDFNANNLTINRVVGGDIDIQSGGSSKIQIHPSTAAILPSTDNTGDVGTSGNTWASGRFTNFTVDGTSTVTTALNVSGTSDFTGNITVDGASLSMGDNDEIIFGDGSDYKIDFNGTHLTIDRLVGGNINIKDSGTDKITIHPSTAAILPSTDNTGDVGTSGNTWASGRFTNFTVDNILSVREAIDLADSDTLRFGADDDYKVRYDGSNFEISQDTDGNILIQNGNVDVITIDPDEISITPSTNNNGKVGTASSTWASGHFTNFTVDKLLHVYEAIDLDDFDEIRFGTGDDYKIYYSGSESVHNAVTGDIVFQSNGTDKFKFVVSSSQIVPTTDDTGEIGTEANTWASGRFTNFTIDNQLTVNGNTQIGNQSSDSHTVNGTVQFNQAITTTDITADNVQIGVSGDSEIDTSTGNLILDSAGGTVNITDNADVDGNLNVDGSATVAGEIINNNFDNDTTPGVRIKSAGNTGRVDIKGNGGSSDIAFTIKSGGTTSTDTVVAMNADGSARFAGGDVNIDSSGNVLVGKTASTGLTEGCELRSTGMGVFTRASANPLQVRRLTDDGDLVEFYKDSGLIGSVGVQNTSLTVGMAGVHRLNIDSSGNVKVIGTGTTSTPKIEFKSSGNVDLNDSTVDLYSQTTNQNSKTFQLFSDIGGTKTEKVFITADGNITSVGPVYSGGYTNGSKTEALAAQISSAHAVGLLIASTGSSFNGNTAIQVKNSSGTEVVGIKADGSITAAGNVGIGTSSPSSALHLSGAATSNSRLTLTQSTAGLSGTIQQGSSGFAVSALGSQSLLLQTNGSERLNIDSSGNVKVIGTGTTSTPKIALNANGSASFAADGTGINFGDFNSSTGHVFFAGGAYKVRRNDSNAAIQVFQNGTTASDIKVQIKADGSATFNNQIISGTTTQRGSFKAFSTGNSGSLCFLVQDPTDSTNNYFKVAGDGSITAAGNVVLGTPSAGNNGVKLFSGGGFNLFSTSNSSSYTLASFTNGDSAEVFKVTANGNISAEGDVKLGSVSTGSSSNSGANLYAVGSLDIQRVSNGPLFRGFEGSSENVTINSGGSIFAAGDVKVGNNASLPNAQIYSSGMVRGTNGTAKAELAPGASTGFRLLDTSGAANVVMGWAGNATFVNRVDTGALTVDSNLTPTSGESIEFFYNSGGYIQAYDRSNSTFKPLRIKSSNYEIGLDGSITADGQVTVTKEDTSFEAQRANGTKYFEVQHSDYKLTLGTADQITLKGANGNITAAGSIVSNSEVRSSRFGESTGIAVAADAAFRVGTAATTKAKIGYDGSAEFDGNLTVDGNTTLGDADSDTLTVNATSTFNSPITAGIITSVNSLSATEVYATKLYGNGENITGIDTSGNFSGEIIVAEGLHIPDTTGIATVGNITINNPAGRITATEFYGDGANLTNTGASLSASSGTQRLVTTSLTSGTMTSAGTDGDLTFNASTNTLSATNFSGSGSGLSSLNASNISSGTISDDRLPGTISSNITGSSASCTGNAATSTNSGKASTVTIGYNNNTNGSYQILWGSGNSVFGTGGVSLNPSTNIISASGFSGSGANLTSIPNSALSNSTISGVSLGEMMKSLIRGSYLTGSDYDGGTQRTWAVDATSTNTASKVVARDSSGNFSAGTITATLSGTATNATNCRVDADNSTNATHYVTFAGGVSGNQRLNSDTGLTYNPSSNTLTASSFAGNATTASNATNAGKLDGYDSSQSSTASTVAVRDGNGHLYVNYLFSSYVNMSHTIATRGSDTIFYSSTDTYIRKNSASGFRTSLNVPTRTGGDASGTWGISISGNATTSSNCTGNAATSSNCSGNSATATKATNADNINIDENDNNTNYQVTFSALNNAGNNRQYIDTDNDHFVYNPSTNLLSGLSYSGNGASLTSLNASNLSSGTVADARLPGTISSNITGSSASCTGNAATSSNCNGNAATSSNCSGNAATSSNCSGNAATATRASDATRVNVSSTNSDQSFRMIFTEANDSTDTSGTIYKDNATNFYYNPSTNVLTAGTFSGSGASLSSLNASNISSGTIADARLPGTISSNITGSSASCTGNAATSSNCSGNAATSTNTNGNAASSTNARVDHDTGNAWHRPVFIGDGQGSGDNCRLYTDNSSSHLGYNPSTNTLRATTFSGALSGNASTSSNCSGNAATSSNCNGNAATSSNCSGNSATASAATNADNINVDEASGDTDYQVLFSANQGAGYQRPYIDSDSGQFKYNPSTQVLSAGTFSGSGASLSSLNASNISSGTISDSRLPGTISSNITGSSASCTGNAATSSNCSGNAATSSNCSGNAATATRASDATNVNVTATGSSANYRMIFTEANDSTDTSGTIYKDSGANFYYNPSSNTLYAETFSGSLSGNAATSSNCSGNAATSSNCSGNASTSSNCSGNAATSSNCSGNAATATNADNINVDEASGDTDYQVLFSDNQGAGYQRPYIDSGSGEFKYNPSTNKLTVGSFAGNGDSITSINASNISSGTISDSRLPGTISSNITGSSASCTGNAATSSNCSGNAATSSNCSGNAATSSNCSGNASTSSNTNGSAASSTNSTNSTNARVDHDTGNAWHRLVFISDGQSSGSNQRLYTDSTSTTAINPSTNEIKATTFVGALSGNASTSSNCSGNAATSSNCNGNAATSSNCSGNAATSSNCNGNAATASGSNGEFSTTTLKVNGNRKVAYAAQVNLSSTYSKGLVVRSDSTSRDGSVALQAMKSDDSVPFIAYHSGDVTCKDLKATGDVYANFSDMRLKDKVGNIEKALDKVCSIETLMYKDNDIAKDLGYKNDRTKVGVSAQSVKEVLPEVIHRAPVDVKIDEETGEESSKTGEDYITVDYSRLVPLLIEAIKEQQVEIEQLKSQINN